MDPTYQASKAKIRWVGKDSAFLLAFILRVEESVRFCPFYEAKHLFFKKNAENQRAKLIFSKWAKILLFNFGLFQQVFDNLKLNNLTKQARRLKLEDRIWRLKLEKRSFWPILRGKTLKTLKINAPNSFFQNEPKFFYIILDFFNKFLTTWNWTIWRKKRGDRS